MVERRARIGIDDTGRVAAQLQRDLLLAGTCFQVPSDQSAGKRQQRDAFVLDQLRGVLVGAGKNRERALRQVGFGEDLADQQGADRGLRGRLEHERAARGDRRRHLVRDQVQRKVERGDEAAQPDRNAPGHAAIAARALADTQLDHLATDADGFLGGDLEGLDQPRDFAARILDRLAGLDAQRLGQRLTAFLEPAHAMQQHLATCIGREGGHRLTRLVAGDDRLAHQCGIAEGHAGRALAGVLVEYVELFARFGRPIGQVQRIVLLELHVDAGSCEIVANLAGSPSAPGEGVLSPARAGATRHRPVGRGCPRRSPHR